MADWLGGVNALQVLVYRLMRVDPLRLCTGKGCFPPYGPFFPHLFVCAPSPATAFSALSLAHPLGSALFQSSGNRLCLAIWNRTFTSAGPVQATRVGLGVWASGTPCRPSAPLPSLHGPLRHDLTHVRVGALHDAGLNPVEPFAEDPINLPPCDFRLPRPGRLCGPLGLRRSRVY